MTRHMLLPVTLAAVLLAMVASIASPARTSAASVLVTYGRDATGFCVSAKATVDGKLVGSAKLEAIVKGQYLLVREVHYSPITGRPIYEALSKFGIGFGNKLEEEKVSGEKKFEIFTTWPDPA